MFEFAYSDRNVIVSVHTVTNDRRRRPPAATSISQDCPLTEQFEYYVNVNREYQLDNLRGISVVIYFLVVAYKMYMVGNVIFDIKVEVAYGAGAWRRSALGATEQCCDIPCPLEISVH